MLRITSSLAVLALFLFSACSKDTSPKACFEFSKSVVKVGDTVFLYNCSEHYSQCVWYLPNGTQSNKRHTQVVMGAAGNYSVKLLIGDNTMKDTNSVSRSYTVQ